MPSDQDFPALSFGHRRGSGVPGLRYHHEGVGHEVRETHFDLLLTTMSSRLVAGKKDPRDDRPNRSTSFWK
jgi:hypothetical protein